MNKERIEKGEHQNARRAALVLDVLSAEKHVGMRLTDVVEATGLGTATVHRLLTGLVANGFVDHNKMANRYFIGLQLIKWAANATERYGLHPFVDSSLERLSSLTEDTVYFSLISGMQSVCVDRREGAYPIKTLTLALGDRRPLGIGAGGMALLAFQSDAFIASVFEDVTAQERYGMTRSLLELDIGETRRTGFAFNPSRIIAGMRGIGIPIRRYDGTAIGAISIAAIEQRLSGERLSWSVDLMTRERDQVEALAGDLLKTPLVKRS